MAFSDRLVAAWYAPRLTPLTAALLPLSLLFRAVAAIRRRVYQAGIAQSASLPVPAVVGTAIIGRAELDAALARASSPKHHPGSLATKSTATE